TPEPTVPTSGPVPHLPEPRPVAVPQLSAAPAPAGIWIQAGAWPDARQARRAADRLGGGATVEEAGPGQFRVLIGPWPDAGTAERSRRAVMSRGYPEAMMISGG
ncbi:SPOR domain-containing protein, partial [Brevundimonas sp.]|uniref:SPOR domain-containing protein n=1 Tax=Brevundimonas sp. TaxID=1871086 RepID=UPI0027E82526